MKQDITEPIVTIRSMRRKDAVAVARLIRGLSEFHGDIGTAKPAFLLQHCLGRTKSAHVWVAVIKTKLIGFVLTYDWVNFVRSHRDCTLDLLFVDASYRSAGIGRLLVRAAGIAASNRGCARILTSSAAGNQSARNFYLGLGFTERTKKPVRYLIEGTAFHKLTKKNNI